MHIDLNHSFKFLWESLNQLQFSMLKKNLTNAGRHNDNAT